MPLLGAKTKDELSLIQDPFFVKNVSSLNIHGMAWANGWRWNGIIEFRAGLTSGSQETGPCKTYEEVIQKLRAIMDEVQRK